MNFKSTGNDNINQSVNEYIQKSDDLHIIGIDRGERHLLYLTVIDMKGQIKEQYSLNEIVNTYKGNEYRTNYHELLSKREDERMKARQSWQTIENIKELKEGYLSQVIHKISELMVKYNAIVVLEDLNMGFMRGRQKVEASVYQITGFSKDRMEVISTQPGTYCQRRLAAGDGLPSREAM